MTERQDYAKFLKRFANGLVAFALMQFCVIKPSWARVLSTEAALELIQKNNLQKQPKGFQSLRKMNLPLSQVEDSLKKLGQSKPAEMSAHVGQTLLFLLAVMGIDLVRGEIVRANQGQPSEEAFHKVIAQAATHVLNDAGIYMSIVGAGAAEISTRYPVQALTTWIANRETRPILHAAIKSLIAGMAATGGWDLAAQLKTEAVYLLETPEERDRMQSLFSTSAGAVRGLLHSLNDRDQKDLALIKQFTWNLFKVSLFSQELRAQWIDNTLRTRLLTGEATLLTAAVTAAGVGTMIIPGGGTVVGFMIGVVAITVAINIPQEVKDSITRGYHGVRKRFNYGRMLTAEQELREMIRSWNRVAWLDAGTKNERLRELILQRQSYRSSYLTIELENLRMLFREVLKKDSAPVSLQTARASFQSAFTGLSSLFAQELKMIERLKASAHHRGTLEWQETIAREEDRILTLQSFFEQVGGLILPIFDGTHTGPVNFKALDGSAQRAIEFIEVSYSRGFDEKMFD